MLLTYWYKRWKLSHFPYCLALQEAQHAIIYLFALPIYLQLPTYLLPFLSLPTHSPHMFSLYFPNRLYNFTFVSYFFYLLLFTKATSNLFVEGDRIRISLKQKMTESYKENLLRDCRTCLVSWPLKMSSMPQFAPGISAASQTEIWVINCYRDLEAPEC